MSQSATQPMELDPAVAPPDGLAVSAARPRAEVAARLRDTATHDPTPHLAHQFRSHRQQFETAKLGMWLFLATEVIFFGGLFCLYAVFRVARPEVFAYGGRLLDVNWGAINTAVLILSSLTMGLAVWCARRNHRKHLTFFLLLTLLLAGNFLLIKCLEYSHKFHNNLVWGAAFYEPPSGYAPPDVKEQVVEGATVTVVSEAEAAPPAGKRLWDMTCRACHGAGGALMARQGVDFRSSTFIFAKTDDELVAFITKGRMPSDPENKTGMQMPPRGGNPMLKDDDLFKIVEYLRTLRSLDGAAPSDGTPGEKKQEFSIPRSFIEPAAIGPTGVNEAMLDGKPQVKEEKPPVPHASGSDRPANGHLFFGLYFLMTGLHGIHLFAGMLLVTYLLVRSMRGHFDGRHFTPVNLGGLYWHFLCMIWVFQFLLLYLIP